MFPNAYFLSVEVTFQLRLLSYEDRPQPRFFYTFEITRVVVAPPTASAGATISLAAQAP